MSVDKRTQLYITEIKIIHRKILVEMKDLWKFELGKTNQRIFRLEAIRNVTLTIVSDTKLKRIAQSNISDDEKREVLQLDREINRYLRRIQKRVTHFYNKNR